MSLHTLKLTDQLYPAIMLTEKLSFETYIKKEFVLIFSLYKFISLAGGYVIFEDIPEPPVLTCA